MLVVLFDVFSYISDIIVTWYPALFFGLFSITNISRFNNMAEEDYRKFLKLRKLIGFVVLLMQIVLIAGGESETLTSYMKLLQYCIKNNTGWTAIISFGIYIVLLRITLWREFKAPLVFYKYKKAMKLLILISIVAFSVMMVDLALSNDTEVVLKSWNIAWVIEYIANVSLLILSAFRTFVTKNQVAIYSNTSMHWERIEIDDIKEVQINDGRVRLISRTDEVINTNIEAAKIEEIRSLISEE